MFQESRKVKIYFSVKAEDKKNFELGRFSVVEYFGRYVQFCLFSTKMAVKNSKKLISEKMAKLNIFVLIFRICKPNSVNLGDSLRGF